MSYYTNPNAPNLPPRRPGYPAQPYPPPAPQSQGSFGYGTPTTTAAPSYGGTYNPYAARPNTYNPPPTPPVTTSTYHSSSTPASPPLTPGSTTSNATITTLEKALAKERKERAELEQREVERITSISLLEEKLRTMTIERSKVEERASTLVHAEEQLLTVQREREQLKARANLVPQLETKLRLEQDEKQKLQQRLATYPAQVAEFEHRLKLEQAEKQRLEMRLSTLQSLEFAIQSERDAKAAVERRLTDLDSELKASQQALLDLGRTKAELENTIRSKDLEISSLQDRITSFSADESSGFSKLNAEITALKASLDERDRELAGLGERLIAETAALNERLYVEASEKVALAGQVRELLVKYEPPPPLVGDEKLYERPPPTDPLPMPKGADPELWHYYTSVDPYHLKAINAAQLEAALNNGPWPPLSYPTAQALHTLYDRTFKSLSFDDFVKVYELVTKWKEVFHKFDGHEAETEFRFMDRKDMKAALKLGGVLVSTKFLENMWGRVRKSNSPIGWDDFVLYAAKIKLIADAFREKDMDKDNWVTISYDQFFDLITNCSL
ncbi:hypothetical protein HK097_002199 [Rhizophlyctis rosea]|uniref:Uncharacterized protein n=1 Tax=Rhizophlyctis rosea TaxID=64517 RepID=A0AAD5WYI8_9FUNG|nr:hypothetical protein HK097_002199 [Rhizophlyctis rosea]